jgi:hypothetical protein
MDLVQIARLVGAPSIAIIARRFTDTGSFIHWRVWRLTFRLGLLKVLRWRLRLYSQARVRSP